MVKIVLIDDHFMVRDGIRAILEEESVYEVVGEAANAEEGLSVINTLQPDIAICDIRMPEVSGITMVEKMQAMGLPTKVIMLSMHDSDEYILQSISAGADGYLLKGASKEEFLKALTVVSNGEKYFSGDVSSILVKKIQSKASMIKESNTINTVNEPTKQDDFGGNQNPFELTKRERQILKLAVSGKTNKDIAEDLNISKRTIEVHRFNLMKKMEVKNALELINKARAYGMIP